MTNDITAAITELNRIAALPDESSDIYIMIRHALIYAPDFATLDDIDTPAAEPHRDAIFDAIRTLTDPNSIYARHALSDFALNYSLCPLHLHDYAICFDDDDAECAQIRACFPIHDS